MKEILATSVDFERALLREGRKDAPKAGGADALARRLGVDAAVVATVAATATATATVAATAGGATKATAAKAATASVVSKILGAFATTGFALGVVTTSAAFGVYEWHSSRTHAPPAAASASTVTAPAPATAPASLPSSSPESLDEPPSAMVTSAAAARKTAAPVRPAISAGARAPAASAGAELGAEVAILSTAKSLLEARNTTGAQAALDRYRREFPQGAFQAEALALEIDIAAADGRNDDVRRLGERFLATFPSSPHVARVRAALASATR